MATAVGETSCCKGWEGEEEKQVTLELMGSSTGNDGLGQDAGCHIHPQGRTREDRGLEGLKYKPLCSCEDQNHFCECRSHQVTIEAGAPGTSLLDNQRVKLESWGTWKCKVLILVVISISLWLLIYLTLFLLKIV